MKGMARAIKRFAHHSGCIVIERSTLEKRKKIGHWALPWFLRRERDQSLCHRRLTQRPLSVMAKM
jgi:hypothetical protein